MPNYYITENQLKFIISEEQLKNVIIRKATPRDYNSICRLTATIDGVESPSQVNGWLKEEGGLNYDATIVAENEQGKIIAVDSWTNGRIENEAEDMPETQPELFQELSSMNYILGMSYVIAPEYRHTGLNERMTKKRLDNLRSLGYDFAVIAVWHSLKTHAMHKKVGFIPFHKNKEAVYYLYPFNDKPVEAVKRHTKLTENTTVFYKGEPLLELGLVNKKDTGKLFPYNKWSLIVYSNDHNPPHLHAQREDWDIEIQIQDGKLYHVKREGKNKKILIELMNNINIWFEMPSYVNQKLTNREMAMSVWEINHKDFLV